MIAESKTKMTIEKVPWVLMIKNWYENNDKLNPYINSHFPVKLTILVTK